MNAFVERHAIVLDVGARYVKGGLSEERAPRCVLRWAAAELLDRRATAREWRPFLAAALRRLCSEELRVNPRYRRVVVCEDVASPRAFRAALVDVLFGDLQVAAVTLVPGPVVALYATSHHTALVVDCGWHATRLMPIYKGIPLPHFYQSAPVGVRSCCRRLSPLVPGTAEAEEAVARACFVRPRALGDDEPPLPAVDADFGDGFVLPAALRSDACEHLFDASSDDDAKDPVGTIPAALRELVAAVPRDIRPALLANVLVIGGGGMLPGLCARLASELAAAPDPEVNSAGAPRQPPRLVAPHFPRNLVTWIGASIYATTDACRLAAIAAAEYAEAPCLPDWMSVAENEL